MDASQHDGGGGGGVCDVGERVGKQSKQADERQTTSDRQSRDKCRLQLSVIRDRSVGGGDGGGALAIFCILGGALGHLLGRYWGNTGATAMR